MTEGDGKHVTVLLARDSLGGNESDGSSFVETGGENFDSTVGLADIEMGGVSDGFERLTIRPAGHTAHYAGSGSRDTEHIAQLSTDEVATRKAAVATWLARPENQEDISKYGEPTWVSVVDHPVDLILERAHIPLFRPVSDEEFTAYLAQSDQFRQRTKHANSCLFSQLAKCDHLSILTKAKTIQELIDEETGVDVLDLERFIKASKFFRSFDVCILDDRISGEGEPSEAEIILYGQPQWVSTEGLRTKVIVRNQGDSQKAKTENEYEYNAFMEEHTQLLDSMRKNGYVLASKLAMENHILSLVRTYGELLQRNSTVADRRRFINASKELRDKDLFILDDLTE